MKGQFNDFIDSPDIQNLIQQLRFEGDVYDTLKVEILDHQVERMTQLNAVLFYPLILEDRLELVVVAPNTQPIRRTVEGVGRQQLNQVIAEFRQALDSPTGDALPPAQQLYRWLIEPLEADLAAAGIETIIYAPDGALRYIPLAALHDGDQWLIQRFVVNNITAISLETLGDTDRSATSDLRILAGAFANEATVYSPEPARGDQYYGLAFAGEESEPCRRRYLTPSPFTTTTLVWPKY